MKSLAEALLYGFLYCIDVVKHLHTIAGKIILPATVDEKSAEKI